MKTFSFILFTILFFVLRIGAYKHFYTRNPDETFLSQYCPVFREKLRLKLATDHAHFRGISTASGYSQRESRPLTTSFFTAVYQSVNGSLEEGINDPLDKYIESVDKILFGDLASKASSPEQYDKNKLIQEKSKNKDPLLQYPSGGIMRAERFANHTAVHMPCHYGFHQGHAALQLTPDFMQTAVNAFFFFTHASLKDILNLPSDYILKSARTISMLTVNLEKLSATWQVVKGERKAEEVPYELLELYRPLFKYLSPREIASLNLTDEKIMTYIGTHPDLERHQVGAVASRYMKINPKWSEARYLNLMGNVMCGIPISHIRRLEPSTFLQLNHQVFFHIRACDPLQRRFFLNMMTKTQVLGRPYSWTARDVTRLGLLIPYLKGMDISSITPEAMAGITAQVIYEMPPEKLKHITEIQMQYLGEKSYNILARRMKAYIDDDENNSQQFRKSVTLIIVLLALGAFY